MIAKHGAEEGQRLYERMVRDRKALALSIGAIDQNRDRAKRTYDENLDGGIFKLYGLVDLGGSLFELSSRPGGVFVTFWFLPNENDGITLMFPEDY